MEVRFISRADLVKIRERKEDFKLVDVLSREHFEQEHIKGAISLPLDEIEVKAKDLFKEDEKIVVYCASFECPASTRAAEKLMQMGFKDVLDYKGGLKDYKEAGLALEGKSVREFRRCATCG